MKKIRFVCLFLTLFLMGCFLGACATKQQGSEFHGIPEAKLFHEAEVALAKGKYKKAIKRFEAMDTQYPFGRYSQQALLNSIYAYYKAGDKPSAVAVATRYTHLYPRSAHVDYAYYMKGVANFEQDRGIFARYFPVDIAERAPGSASEAFNDFKLLVTLFSDSIYVPDAKQRMIFLRNMFARHQLEVAKFYMHKHAYLAAANRASHVVQQYQQAPQAYDALKIMVKANHALGSHEAAAEAEEVLQTNFPGHA